MFPKVQQTWATPSGGGNMPNALGLPPPRKKRIAYTIENSLPLTVKKGVNSSMLFSGASGSGKTAAIRALWNQNKHQWDWVILFCNSPSVDHEYSFIPENCRLEWAESTLTAIMQTQRDYIKAGQTKNLLLIFDDVIAGSINHNNKLLNKLMTSARHYAITVIVATQRLTLVSPTIRDNVQVVLGTKLGESQQNEMLKIADCFPNQWEGKEFLRQVAGTKKEARYQFFVVHREDPDDKPFRIIRFPYFST